MLGEAIDPFSAAQGGSRAKGEDSAASKDKEYQSLLDSGDEVMGTIKIPKISVNLPIYHGTSQTALASGAGHLYGSSLPVGGDGTHSVITGHRGLVNAMMFTRLDEMKTGDFFYIEVMGETLGYEVDRITVINPDDTSQLKIVPGEDRVTLMTCTPYGVNTQRLLISGHREPIPMPAPDPSDLHDTRTIMTMVVVCGLLGGWLLLGVIGRFAAAVQADAARVVVAVAHAWVRCAGLHGGATGGCRRRRPVRSSKADLQGFRGISSVRIDLP